MMDTLARAIRDAMLRPAPRAAAPTELGGDAGVAPQCTGIARGRSSAVCPVSQRPPARRPRSTWSPDAASSRHVAKTRSSAAAAAVGRRPTASSGKRLLNRRRRPATSSGVLVPQNSSRRAPAAHDEDVRIPQMPRQKQRRRARAAGTTTRAFGYSFRSSTSSAASMATPVFASFDARALRYPRRPGDACHVLQEIWSAIQDQQHTAGNHQVSKERARLPAPMRSWQFPAGFDRSHRGTGLQTK